ncbi:MAG: EamA family transporter RarD [Thermoanaerobaculales bacterium]|jgi:chloramphenicol-sensitive protein RarD|nr:EamA family transporter RarD [Thermoanaerobaculales bacterium]
MSREDLRAGVAYGVAAYGIWGLVPLYFKAVAEVAPLEVLAHRIVWSVVLLLPLAQLRGQWPVLRAAVADRRTLAVLALTTVLIATNWFVFILAVDTGRVLEASLGYFINPLVNVFLGMVFLGERLSRPAAAAVGLAGLAVAVQTAAVGAAPWIALTLASSFGVYGLLRKTAAVGSVVGLTIETALLAPAALGFLVWSGRSGSLAFGGGDPLLSGLLALAGVVTAVPLLAFTSAARRLRLTTMGFLQYLSPTGHFLLAVLVFGEPLDPVRLASFACIWVALAVFTADQLRRARA